MTEPKITINGVELSEGQAMAVRVACSIYLIDLSGDPESLGTDEHGRRMVAAYTDRLSEVIMMMRQPE